MNTSSDFSEHKPRKLRKRVFKLVVLLCWGLVIGVVTLGILRGCGESSDLSEISTSEDYIDELVDDADNLFGRREYEMAMAGYDRALETLKSIFEFEERRTSPDTQLLDQLLAKEMTTLTKRQIASFGGKVGDLQKSLVTNTP